MTEYSREMIANIDQRFGERLRAERDRRDMSQAHLLMMLQLLYGIRWHQSTVTKVEGGTRPVRLHEAVAIASILQSRLEDLLDDPNSPGARRRRAVGTQARMYELVGLANHVEHRYQHLQGVLDKLEPGEGDPDDGEYREAT